MRNCEELGLNLQKIVSRLLANEDLVKLLYYNDKDPLNQPTLTQEEKQKYIYQNLIKIVPRQIAQEQSKSSIVIYPMRGMRLSGNSEFDKVSIIIDVYTPLIDWIIKDSNLRPFAIIGKINASLNGKTINGLGKIQIPDFHLTRLTDEISCYTMTVEFTEYD